MTDRQSKQVEWTLTGLQTYIAHQFYKGQFYLEFEEAGYDWDQAWTSTEMNGTHFKLFTVKLVNDVATAKVAATFTLATRIHKYSEFWPGWRCVMVERRAPNEMSVSLYGGRYIVHGESQPCSPPRGGNMPSAPLLHTPARGN